MPAPPALAKSLPSAADNVLLSKITPPACKEWVIRRSRIEERIAAGPLTVVTGPPGAGKTTAVASWLAVAEDPVAWVTLDRYDSRPDVFWSTVVAALRTRGRRVPPGAPVARSDGQGRPRVPAEAGAWNSLREIHR